ncbi:hypothetical protein CVA86_RS21880 [Vibrio parahaemolyticus]|nr:hypothetical protein [Vibrio parahaemolyticus]
MTTEDIQFWSMVGTWVAGIGTVLAVILSLYLAISERRVSLFITSGVYDFDDGSEKMVIKIVNNGSRPVTISNPACIALQAGWFKNKKCLGVGTNYISFPSDDKFPYQLNSGDGFDFGINLNNQDGNWLVNLKSSFLQNRSLSSLRVVVFPNGSKPIKAKLGKSIMRLLK